MAVNKRQAARRSRCDFFVYVDIMNIIWNRDESLARAVTCMVEWHLHSITNNAEVSIFMYTRAYM